MDDYYGFWIDEHGSGVKDWWSGNGGRLGAGNEEEVMVMWSYGFGDGDWDGAGSGGGESKDPSDHIEG